MGKKRGLEDGLKRSNEEQLNGMEDRMRLGEFKEHGRRLTERHGPGLCSKPDDKRRKGCEEGIEEGMNLGHGEGYLVTKEGFNRIIQAVKDKATPKRSSIHEMATQANDSLQ